MALTPDDVAKHKKDMWKIRLIGLGILGFGLLVGILPFVWELYADTWPTVKAVVTRSHINHDTDDDDYTLTVWYQYEINGQQYTGSYNRNSGVRPDSVREGSMVDVHYNPALPMLSRLDAAINVTGLMMGCCCLGPFGLLFLAISFLPPQKSVNLGKMRRLG